MDIKPTLTICIPAKTEICALTVMCLNYAKIDKNLTSQINIVEKFAIGQSDLPKIRSNELTDWYENKASPGDYFLFLDADQIFSPVDIIQGLYYVNKVDVVCGAYAKKSDGITVEPMFPVDFYDKKEGELWYGATGFMFIKYDTVHKLVNYLQNKYLTARNIFAYPFFYERIVKELGIEMWLSEDYSFCWLVRSIGGNVYGFISPTLGHIVPNEKFVLSPKSHKWKNNSIVYYCHSSTEKWCPKSLLSGIGGSETAVIKLSKLFYEKGYEVTVFCDCSEPGNYEGVVYKDVKEFNFMDMFNILIIWRDLKILETTDIKAKIKILDVHDIVNIEQLSERLISNTDYFFTKSLCQASVFPKNKTVIISNGGGIKNKLENIEKDENYLIYTSSYDRGLFYMLKYGWPIIKKECPNVYLKIFYGWDIYDKVHKKETEFKKDCRLLMQQNGVYEMGRVSQDQLMIEKMKANIHYYIGDFQEIDCIAVRESASVGTIPVVSNNVEVFREKSYCYLVEGDPTSADTQEKGARIIIDLLKDVQKLKDVRKKLNLEYETWEDVANRWLENIQK